MVFVGALKFFSLQEIKKCNKWGFAMLCNFELVRCLTGVCFLS